MINLLTNRNTYIFLGIIIIIIVMVVLIRSYLKTFVTIKEFPVNAKSNFKVSSKLIQFSHPHRGLTFTHTFWLYVNDWNYRYMTEKFIINKGEGEGGFSVYLGAKNNNLYIEFPILHCNRPERIVYENIPIQKWVNVTIVLENRYVDLWLNGKLYHSRHLSNVPNLTPGEDMKYLTNGGFSGYLSRIYHYNNNLSKLHIESIFKMGPVDKNPFVGIIRKIRNVFTSGEEVIKAGEKCFSQIAGNI